MGTSTVAAPSEDFHPINDASWKHGQPVPYAALADVFAKIEVRLLVLWLVLLASTPPPKHHKGTSSRLHIIAHLSNLFRSIIVLSPKELLTAIYLCTNQLGPSFEGLELGVGESIIMKAIGETCGKTLQVCGVCFLWPLHKLVCACVRAGAEADVHRARRPGSGGDGVAPNTEDAVPAGAADAGRRVQELPQHRHHERHQVGQREAQHHQEAAGGSQGQRDEVRCVVLVACWASQVSACNQGSFVGLPPLSAANHRRHHHHHCRYIVRSLQGKLRIGLAAKSVLVAVVHALVLTPPDAAFPPRLVNRHREGDVRGPALKLLLEESVALVKEVYSEVPSYEAMLPVLLNTADIPHGQVRSCPFATTQLDPQTLLLLGTCRRSRSCARDATSSRGCRCTQCWRSPRAASPRCWIASARASSRASTSTTGSAPRCTWSTPRCAGGVVVCCCC